MNLLIPDNSALIDYLPIDEGSFDFDRILPFLRHAQRKYIVPAISQAEFEALEKSGDKSEVYDVLAHATAHFGMHLGFVQLSSFLTNAGVLQPNPTKEAKQLSWAERKDLQRHYLRTGLESIDQALTLMEAKKEVFTHWVDSEAYTVFDESFCTSAAAFSRYQNINGSGQTFLRLRPLIREVWQQYFAEWLSADVVTAVKGDKELNALAQQAEAAYTVMKAIQQDGFQERASFLQAIIEVLPWEKLVMPSDAEIRRRVEIKREQGDNAIERLHEQLLESDIDYSPPEVASHSDVKTLRSGLMM